MKTVSILVPESAVLQGIADPRYMFTAVNMFLQNAGKHPLFHVQLVGMTKEVKLNGGTFSINADVLYNDVKKTDLIIIPPLSGDLNAAIKLNKDFIPWIQDQYSGGAQVASLCLGAFLLASTGLLVFREALQPVKIKIEIIPKENKIVFILIVKRIKLWLNVPTIYGVKYPLFFISSGRYACVRPRLHRC